MKKFTVLRFSSQRESTLGLFFDASNESAKPTFLCFTLEDEKRTLKKFGETRIPAGTYDVELRTFGGFHKRYSGKFPSMHKGMLWVKDVENFTDILIHIGNKDDDTAGCLLLGNSSHENITSRGFISSSSHAYCRVYPAIAEALERGERVTIEYVDFDEAKDMS